MKKLNLLIFLPLSKNLNLTKDFRSEIKSNSLYLTKDFTSKIDCNDCLSTIAKFKAT